MAMKERGIMYKLVALDIDDTLLNVSRKLSAENKKAIQEVRAAGVFVILATGRFYAGMTNVCEQLELDNTPVITMGGAQIQNYPSGELLYERTMPLELVEQCIQFAKDNKVYIQCYQDETFYYENVTSETHFYENRINCKGTQRDFTSIRFNHTNKCVLIAEPFVIEKLIPIAKNTFGDKAQVMRSYSRILEIYPPDTNKGVALEWLAEGLGVRQEEVLAMGDSALDMPMIQYAGMGVAVSNAEQDLINISNYVAPHADSNAVAHVLRKYVLGEKR